MNAKQLSKLTAITSKINAYEKDLNGAFEFQVTKHNDEYMLFACNTTNAEWFMPHKYACIFIGPRGGTKIKSKSFDLWYI